MMALSLPLMQTGD